MRLNRFLLQSTVYILLMLSFKKPYSYYPTESYTEEKVLKG